MPGMQPTPCQMWEVSTVSIGDFAAEVTYWQCEVHRNRLNPDPKGGAEMPLTRGSTNPKGAQHQYEHHKSPQHQCPCMQRLVILSRGTFYGHHALDQHISRQDQADVAWTCADVVCQLIRPFRHGLSQVDHQAHRLHQRREEQLRPGIELIPATPTREPGTSCWYHHNLAHYRSSVL